MSLHIRTNTWLRGMLSWSYVSTRLCNAFEELGHNVYVISTNGIENSDPYLTEEKMVSSLTGLEQLRRKNIPIDLDWCYTVPTNFPKRFLPNSRYKAAIYNYETWRPGGNGWVADWKKYYHLVDFYFPSSNFSAEIFHLNGIPKEKIFVIPHGVDTEVFNPDVKPIKLKTKKSMRFVAVMAPHYRKNIDTLLEAYCRAFTAKDDVCLVLKTKVYKHSDGIYHAANNPNGRKLFEVVIGDMFKKIYKKYGKNIPEIELLGGHVDNVAEIYNACDVHVSTTGAEGWGLPFAESISCGLINIAPRYSGHLDFLNDDNSLLIDTDLREAHRLEQYWSVNKGSKIGQPNVDHAAELMQYAYKNYKELKRKFDPGMKKMVKQFSWTNAAQRIIDVIDGKVSHYTPGTYDLFNQHKIKDCSGLRIY